MSKKGLPKTGDGVPVEKFHVSPCNMRADVPFDPEKSDEDRNLMNQLRRGEIVQAFLARPEGDGFGVYVGGRKFQAKKLLGVEEFTLGDDCLIKDVSEEEAREASFIENWPILRKEVDPITRAEGLAKVMRGSIRSLRDWARRWDMPVSLLSEYLKPLELSPKMRQALRRGDIFFTDGLEVARMKLGTALQDELAEVAEKEGVEAFKRELNRIPTGKMKRGIPKGKFDIIRVAWDRRYKPDVELLEEIDRRAETKNMKRDEWTKWFLRENIKIAARATPSA